MKNVIKNIVLFLFIIITTISIFVYVMLDTTKSLVEEDNIKNIIKEINIEELIGTETEDKIYEILEKTGMPKEYADYILKSSEFKEYVGKYTAEGIELILNHKEVKKLDKKETTDIIVSSWNQALEEAKKNNIDVEEYITEEEQNKIIDKIEEYTPEIIDKVMDLENTIKTKIDRQYQDKIEKINNTLEMIRKIYNCQSLLKVFIIVEFIIILLLNIKKTFKNIAFPFGINAFLLFTINFIIPIAMNHYYPVEFNFMKSIFEAIIHNLMFEWQNIGIIFVIVFILLIIIQIILNTVLKKKPKDMEIW